MNPLSVRPTILIADDFPIIRAGIKENLNGLHVNLIEVEDGVQVLQCLMTRQIDIVILDVKMPELDGIEVIMRWLKVRPKTHSCDIIVFTEFDNPFLIKALYDLGIRSIVSKKDGNLRNAVTLVLSGRNYISASLNRTMNAKVRPIVFTKQELKILALSSVGMTSMEIATILCLKKTTVDFYRKRLLEKFGTENLTELVDYAHRIGKL